MSKSYKRLWQAVFLIFVCCCLFVGFRIAKTAEMDVVARAIKYDNDGAKAITYLMPLAYLGDTTAQSLMGMIYAEGMAGVPKDDEKAEYWFIRAAQKFYEEDGSPAIYELAVARDYAEGFGVKVNKVESEKWVRRAVESGSKEAVLLLDKIQKSE